MPFVTIRPVVEPVAFVRAVIDQLGPVVAGVVELVDEIDLALVERQRPAIGEGDVFDDDALLHNYRPRFRQV